MTVIRLLKYVLLAVLSVQTVYTAGLLFSRGWGFDYQHGLAICLLAICIVLHFFSHHIAQWATLITILLGVFDVISFRTDIHTVGFWIGPGGIIGATIQVFSFCIALLFLIVNWGWVRRWFATFQK